MSPEPARGPRAGNHGSARSVFPGELQAFGPDYAHVHTRARAQGLLRLSRTSPAATTSLLHSLSEETEKPSACGRLCRVQVGDAGPCLRPPRGQHHGPTRVTKTEGLVPAVQADPCSAGNVLPNRRRRQSKAGCGEGPGRGQPVPGSYEGPRIGGCPLFPPGPCRWQGPWAGRE